MFGITSEWWILYDVIIVIAFVVVGLSMKGVEIHKRTIEDLLSQISNNLGSVKEVNRRLEAVLKYYFPYRGADVNVGIDSIVEELRELNEKLHKIEHELFEIDTPG